MTHEHLHSQLDAARRATTVPWYRFVASEMDDVLPKCAAAIYRYGQAMVRPTKDLANAEEALRTTERSLVSVRSGPTVDGNAVDNAERAIVAARENLDQAQHRLAEAHEAALVDVQPILTEAQRLAAKVLGRPAIEVLQEEHDILVASINRVSRPPVSPLTECVCGAPLKPHTGTRGPAPTTCGEARCHMAQSRRRSERASVLTGLRHELAQLSVFLSEERIKAEKARAEAERARAESDMTELEYQSLVDQRRIAELESRLAALQGASDLSATDPIAV
jgi:hypothetical protein